MSDEQDQGGSGEGLPPEFHEFLRWARTALSDEADGAAKTEASAKIIAKVMTDLHMIASAQVHMMHLKARETARNPQPKFKL